MRTSDLLRLFEAPLNIDQLEAMKSVIAGKIKKLPDDDATAKTLKEIEELLQHVSAGGRMGMINQQLVSINDPAVTGYQKRLAQYIASMEVDPKDRAELFAMWKGDKLVNIDKLLSRKKYAFDEIFNGYSTNPAIKELVDDVMEESALGQGKGEFGLNVLSKSVSKPGKHYDPDAEGSDEAKGDLLMKSGGKWRKIEVKTTHGGAARFSDQEVRPAEGYEMAKSNLNAYVSTLARTNPVAKQLYGARIPAYGVNLTNAIVILQAVKPAERTKLLELITTVITTIFGGRKANQKDITKIMSAVKAYDDGSAKQFYAQASFNYYMSKKDDDGVLAIDLNSKSFMFYTNASDLEKESMRLHADTIYLSANDVARGAYPQMSVIPTTFGANARASAEKAARELEYKTARDNPVELGQPGAYRTKKQLEQHVQQFAQNLAIRKRINNPQSIAAITQYIMQQFAMGTPTKKISTGLNVLAKQMTQPAPAAPVPPAPIQTAPRQPRGQQPAGVGRPTR
jgi:hypothetical protein